MVIFHGYVNLPDGNIISLGFTTGKSHQTLIAMG